MSEEAPGGEQVFLAATDPETFERTVAAPAELPADRPAELPDEARLYPVPEGSRSTEAAGRMGPGDLVLFYADGGYVGVGRVAATFEDAALGEALWNEPAPAIVQVEAFAPLSTERAPVNRLFDYGAGYAPSGLMRVAPDRVTASVGAIELAVRRFDERRD